MTPVRRTEYHFEHTWTIGSDATVEQVYDVLEDVEAYPAWWRSVRAVGRVADDVALLACRSTLPVTLHVVLRPQRQDRDAGTLQGELSGDLDGWSRFTVSPAATGGVELLHEQRVRVASPWLELGSRLARPVLVWNHDRMMAVLREDLDRRLLSACGR